MNVEDFLQILQQEGFPEPVEVQQIPNGVLGIHAHPFEVRALVTQGSIEIVLNGVGSTYLSGDTFHLDFEQEHSESYGPAGVSYLASRKLAGNH